MTLYQIIKIYGFNPAEFKLVRHGYRELNPLETYRSNRELFDAYQAIQRTSGSKNYDDARYIAVFAPYHGTQAILLGVWEVHNKIPAEQAPEDQLKLIRKYGWNLTTSSYYELSPVSEFFDLSERLVIEWGKSTVTWIQRKDKEVVSLFPMSHVAEFTSYEQTIVSWNELVNMTKNQAANFTWVNALKAVNGIYCITNTENGRSYVGSAYGRDGIWGRWSSYVATGGHGGNDLLIAAMDEDPKVVETFQFSILEILPGSSTADDAIAKENLWKEKLGTRVGGYNNN